MKRILIPLILLFAGTDLFADNFNSISIQGQLNPPVPITNVSVDILSEGRVVGAGSSVDLIPNTAGIFSTQTYLYTPKLFLSGSDYVIRLSTPGPTIISTFSIHAVPLALAIRGDNQTGDQNVFGAYGNVGLGTTAPAYRLVISSGAGESGNMVVISTGTSTIIRMTGAGEIHANKYYGDGSALTGITASGDNLGDHTATTSLNMANNQIINVSSMTVTGNAFSVGGSTFVVKNGDIGIGTLNPGAKAEITGSLFVTGYTAAPTGKGMEMLYHTGGDMAILQSHDYGTATYKPFAIRANPLLILNGNVGIGTMGPGYKLDVQGGDINAGANLREAGVPLSGKYAYMGGSNAGGTWPVNITGTAAGAPPIGAAGGVLTGTYPNPELATSQTTAATWTGAQAFNGGASFPGSGIWGASGNVGIGTTNPGAKAEITGSLFVTGYTAAPTGKGMEMLYHTGGDMAILQSHDYGTATDKPFAIIGNPLLLLNGNVGIGTRTPANKLEVAGTVSINSGTNTIYYCNKGPNAGLLGRGNKGSCPNGNWVATSLKLD